MVSVISLHITEYLPPQTNQTPHRIQTDDIDLDFSKVLIDYIKSIQHQSSQRANSIFTNDVFSIIQSYNFILESNELYNVSPPQTSLHAVVKQEINLYSQFLDSIRKTLTDNEISQIVEVDLQRIVTWFIIDYFVLNLDLLSTARKSFRPQTSDDETI